MSRLHAATAVVLASVAAVAPVAADSGDGEPGLTPAADFERVGPRGHWHQFGLGVSLVTGYRFVTTWDADDYCGDRAGTGDGGGNAAYCFTRTPFAFDVALSYGLTRSVELMLDIRLGIERDFGGSPDRDGPRLRHYAPGVKFWLTGDRQLDFFSTAQVAIDTTGYQDAAGEDRGADVRLRNANGLQLDFHDAYGVYLYFAEEVAFRRWLEIGLEGGFGFQGRYP